MADRLVVVINGPNLNLLGRREPEIYGHDTLADIAGRIDRHAAALGLVAQHFQSNHEGALVDRIQQAAADGAHAIVLNAGALTHTSVALYDAIRAVPVPVIEVHLSNPHAREDFRRHSYVAMAAKGSIAGFGPASYLLALDAAAGITR